MIKRIFLGLLVIGLFSACSDKEEKTVAVVDNTVKKQEMKKTVSNDIVKVEIIVEKKEEMKSPLKKPSQKMENTVEIKVEKLKPTIQKSVKIDPIVLFKACVSCHGAKAQNKALGKSDVINTWSEEQLIAALKGYKNGTYGKTMKALMKSQVSKLSDKEIESLSKYITTLNK